jgi:hypothetical protein
MCELTLAWYVEVGECMDRGGGGRECSTVVSSEWMTLAMFVSEAWGYICVPIIAFKMC